MNLIISGLAIDRKRLLEGFTPPVFATDRALELVSGGMPFRDAYDKVKSELNSLSSINPYKAVKLKNHEGAPAGLDFASYRKELTVLRRYFGRSLKNYSIAISRLISVR
jgi:argininosuccinate lyase